MWTKAGDDAIVTLDEGIFSCRVLKVRGGTIKGYESGNVLVEITSGLLKGEQRAVIGTKIEPCKQ